jgi:hypothetical protein
LEISWDYDVDLWDTISSTWNTFVEDTSYGNHFAVYLRITPVTYITKDYYIQLHGFWTGEQVDGLMVVAKLLDKISVTPATAKIDYVPFEGWIESSASDRLRYASHCSSRFAFDSLSDDFFSSISTTLQEMIDYDNYADPTNEDELTYGIPTEFLFIAPAGGAISEYASNATAFPWRDATYLFVVCERYMSDYENSHNFVEEWIVSTMATMEPFLSDKSFINFPDNNLANWQASFYGDNYQQLQTVKAKYDPNNVFNFQFSIEQPATASNDDKTVEMKAKPKSKENKKQSTNSDSGPNAFIKVYGQTENEQLNDKKKDTILSEFPVWNSIFIIFTVISIALIYKAIKRCKDDATYNEYIPVNNHQISAYNTI